MKIIEPKVTRILPTGLFTGRNAIGVFLYKHGVSVNLDVIMTEAERAIDSSPQKCLLLPEGLHSYRSAENLYIDRIAHELSVEAVDPIVKPFSARIARSARISDIEAALSVFINYVDFIFGVDVNEMDDQELEEWFNTKLDVVACAFDVKPEEIRDGFEQLVQLGGNKKAKQIARLSFLLDALIKESNQQSKLKLLEILARKKQPRILAMSGIAHEPVFSQ